MSPIFKRGIAAAGTCILLFSAGCEPASTDPLVGFAGDFVRSLIAALLL